MFVTVHDQGRQKRPQLGWGVSTLSRFIKAQLALRLVVEQVEGHGCIVIVLVYCAVSLLETLRRGVEKEQLQVEDIAAAGVEDVDAADVLPPLSAVDEVWMVRYHVHPAHLSRAGSTGSDHKLLKVLAVLELVERRVLGSAEVVLQFGHGCGISYLLVAFLEDDELTAGKVNWQWCHTGVSIVDMETENPPGSFTCR